MKAFLEYIKQNKNSYKVIIGIGIVGMSVGLIAMRNNSYAISVDGQVVGIVKTKEEAKVAYETAVKDVKNEAGVPIAVNETITIEHVNSTKEEIQTLEDVTRILQESVSYEVEAYEILVDGEVYAVVDSQQTAEEVLATIAKTHLPEGSKVKLDVTNLESEEASGDATEEMASVSTEATTTRMMATPLQQANTKQVNTTPTKTQNTANNVTTDSVATQTITDEEGKMVERLEVQEAVKAPEVRSAVTVASIEKKEEAEEAPVEGQKIQRELKVFDFNEDVLVRSTYIDEEEIVSKEEAIDILLSNTEEVIEYEMQEGDNIWDIAIAHGTTMEHILEINPQIVDETRMQIGEVIKLEVPEPILSISTTEEATFKELIPSEIEYVEFSDMYEDETKIYQEGYDGLKEITVDVHKVNGKEVSRELISEKVLKEPKTKVIAYGTKERPTEQNNTSGASGASASVSASNQGQFMHPLNGAGRISSPYGSRWGSFHRGMDIAAPAGTPIYAAASGVVTYSGYNNGGYGKMIIIDHQNGYETYYAHNNSLYVQVGQKVSKGQNIASVGSTGNSTGNHVHFEIRSGGSPINPYNYIY